MAPNSERLEIVSRVYQLVINEPGLNLFHFEETTPPHKDLVYWYHFTNGYNMPLRLSDFIGMSDTRLAEVLKIHLDVAHRHTNNYHEAT